MIKGDEVEALRLSHPHVWQWYIDRDVTDKYHPNYLKWNGLVYAINVLPPEAKGENFDKWIINGGYTACSDDVKSWYKLSIKGHHLDFLLEDIMRHV